MSTRRKKAVSEVKKMCRRGAKYIDQGDTTNALTCFTDAFNSSKVLSLPVINRGCAFNIGAAYISIGDAENAIVFLEKALPPEDTTDGKSNGDLYFNLALAYEKKDIFEKMQRYLEKAHQAYKSEKNLLMGREVLQRLVRLPGIECKQKITWLKSLAQTYSVLEEYEYCALTYLACLHDVYVSTCIKHFPDTPVLCLKAIEDTQKAISSSSAIVATMFNNLGIFYIQHGCEEHYLKAQNLFFRASEAIQNSTDELSKAVITQNVAVVNNMLEEFEEAIQHDDIAIEIFGRLKDRQSQGDCFVNQAYSYSHLNQMENAMEAFLHALQAAKDCNDKMTLWKALEGLGAVATNMNQLSKALGYYKQAMEAAISASVNQNVQDRIYSKFVIVVKNLPSTEHRNIIKSISMSSGMVVEVSEITEDWGVPALPTTERNTQTKSYSQDQKVFRSGTLGQDMKMARGLELATDEDIPSSSADSVVAYTTDYTTDTHTDGDGVSDGDDDKPHSSYRKKPQPKRHRPVITKRMSSKQRQDPEGNVLKTKRPITQLLIPEDDTIVQQYKDMIVSKDNEEEITEDEQPGRNSKVTAQVHFPRDNESNDDQPDSRDSTDGNEPRSPPPVPAHSPDITPMPTYEIAPRKQEPASPAADSTHHDDNPNYESLDLLTSNYAKLKFDTSPRVEGEMLTLVRRLSKGPNFFHSTNSSTVSVSDQESETVSDKSQTQKDGEPGTSGNDTVYESVNPVSDEKDAQKIKDKVETFSYRSCEDEEAHVREERMYQYHAGVSRKQTTQKAESKEKKSKLCVVM